MLLTNVLTAAVVIGLLAVGLFTSIRQAREDRVRLHRSAAAVQAVVDEVRVQARLNACLTLKVARRHGVDIRDLDSPACEVLPNGRVEFNSGSGIAVDGDNPPAPAPSGAGSSVPPEAGPGENPGRPEAPIPESPPAPNPPQPSPQPTCLDSIVCVFPPPIPFQTPGVPI